ncbi:MAG: tetratricopeptide repeat protein, partial [Termitinemataceae bacterium]
YVTETPIERRSGAIEQRPSSLADEIRDLVETGTPPSLIRALDIMRSRELTNTEQGRLMVSVAVIIMKRIYPDIHYDLPAVDMPAAHGYTKILRDAERGIYTPAPTSSNDVLELILPFFALLEERRPERLAAALPDIERAVVLNPRSALAWYFYGLLKERTGKSEAAYQLYQQVIEISLDCYPAVLASARVLSAMNRKAESLQVLTELLTRYPEQVSAKRELAVLYYENGDWSRAEPILAELLQKEPRDRQLLLMRARVLVEQGKYLQANPLLDIYGGLDPNNPHYLYLRARIQAEAYRNRDSALTYLRAVQRQYPEDPQAIPYLVRLLIESDREADRLEGTELLQVLMKSSEPTPALLDLALRLAIQKQDWNEALKINTKLLESRRNSEDLEQAVRINLAMNRPAQALSFAQELYDRNSSNDQVIYLYIQALIRNGRQEQSLSLIESRLKAVTSSAQKSRYFYLRSLLKSDEEAKLNDLRSSLFEDPRNLDALIAMLEIYHKRKDERRAVYYLKQALALSPDNPILQPYKKEYAASLIH